MRPDVNDYAPYYQQYMDKVDGEDILLVLDKQLFSCLDILKKIPKEKEDYAYAPGKWTVKELIGHITDTERIYAYRALRFSRNDKNPLPGYEQDDYVKEYPKNRKLSDIINELELLRQSNILLFKSFNEEMLNRTGNANGYDITVLSILFVVAGHLEHHIRILQERYLL